MGNTQPEPQVEMELQLVEELKRMRDALTKLSLVMHDLQFAADAPQQIVAREIADDFISRSQS
jgi:Ni,Fe-hydrogenase III large subunit